MKHRPTKAFVLAAGFGTRLLPLTRIVPKPLLPLWGVPMLDRALDMVRSWGVREVVVNVHHGANAIVRHLVARNDPDLRIEVSFEPEILGTGGALARAAWFFDDGKPFWVVNADVAAAVSIDPLLRAFVSGKTLASAWMMASRGPRTVECRGGYVSNFQSQTPGAGGTFTFCGVHLVDPEVLRFLPPAGFASVIKAYQDAMKKGWKIAGVPIEDAFWADVGTPAQYIEAHREMARDKSAPFVCVSEGAVVERGARLSDCVVLPGARVGRDVTAKELIVGPDVRIDACSGIMAMNAADALDEHEQALTTAWTDSLQGAIACPLAPRGSARSFTRLYAGSRTAILVRHKPEREENKLYAGHARFLRSLHLPVPLVIAENATRHLALFEDSGEQSVQDVASGWGGQKVEELYRDVLNALLVFHESGAREARRRKVPLMPPFDGTLFDWEHNLFTGLFLRDRMGCAASSIKAVHRELKRISRQLLKAERVLVHRDLQSSNIILKHGTWSFIDFQGMRMGPAVYDLASLLCDPYIEMAGDVRGRLLHHYAQGSAPGSACLDLFWPGAVQRLGQALGAYARLGALPGTAHFVRYIRPALINVSEALRHIERAPVMTETIASCLARTS